MGTNSGWIKIANRDAVMDGYLAIPPAGTGPGIVLLQEIFGVNAHIRSIADQYASAGFVVLAPDMFWRLHPKLDLGYSESELQYALNLWRKLDVPQVTSDIGVTVRALRALPAVTGKIAAVGYCFGGRIAYLAAAEGALDAAVSYYGGGIHSQLDRATDVNVPILFHYAEHDDQIPLSAVENVKASFAGRHNATFHIYPGTEHGFNCWGREMYQQRASVLALGRTLTFLAEAL